MYLLKLFHDHLEHSGKVRQGVQAQHSIAYIAGGSATINGVLLQNDTATYFQDYAIIDAGEEGSTIWRWELVPAADPLHLLRGDGVTSRLRMSRSVKMFELVPTSKWLFRLDCIQGFVGSTGLHSHPGSGIRCMLEGQLRAVSDKGESSDNRNRGDAWYEEGAYPLVSTVDDPSVKTTFLRGMVLPPEYTKFGDTATFIEGQRATIDGWKAYAQTIVTLR
jgi:hypothetical protein